MSSIESKNRVILKNREQIYKQESDGLFIKYQFDQTEEKKIGVTEDRRRSGSGLSSCILL